MTVAFCQNKYCLPAVAYLKFICWFLKQSVLVDSWDIVEFSFSNYRLFVPMSAMNKHFAPIAIMCNFDH